MSDSIEDVGDVLPGLIWIAACGRENNSAMGIMSVILGTEEKKYQDLLMNIKKHHCHENTTAKLKSSNHTCLFQSYRSVYKVM